MTATHANPAGASDRAGVRRAVESAWDGIAGHLREEAAWRAGREEIVPLPRYETRFRRDIPPRPIWLQAEFSSWGPILGSGGDVVGQNQTGDVFEQADAMIVAGGRALESLLAGIDWDDDEATGRVVEAAWTPPGGWRDGCRARLALIDSGSSAGDGTVPEGRSVGRPPGMSTEERLGDVLRRAMVGCEVVEHPPGGPGDRHDFDLRPHGKEIVARVEATRLTSETAENWSNTRQKPKTGAGTGPRHRWRARPSLSDPSGGAWRPLDGDKNERRDHRTELERHLIERIVWAVSACRWSNKQ